jgi:hypothetical protein
MVVKRSMGNLSGSVIELSNYLEQRISQKSAEYAAVSLNLQFPNKISKRLIYVSSVCRLV